MKKCIPALLVLIMLTTGAAAETAGITGTWLLTEARMGGKRETVYQTMTFRPDGYTEMSGRVFGSWKENKENTISIVSDMIHEFQGTWNIEKDTGTELVLKSDSRMLFFSDYDLKKIEQANKNSGFSGVWKLNVKSEDNADIYIQFALPDKLSIKYLGQGFSGSGGGMWFYNGKNSSIVLTVRDRDLRGTSTVVSMKNNEFLLKKSGKEIKGKKLEQDAENRQRLTMSQEEKSHSETLRESSTFSWFNREARISYLKRVKTLVYNKSTLLADFNVFVTESRSAQVSLDENTGNIHIEKVFGNLSAGRNDGENVFYPVREPDSYIVLGKKNITVPAGTFTCEIIEADDDFAGSKTRLYMIENRPGVYARIISVEKNFDDESYTMYELTTIEGDFTVQNNKRITGKWILAEITSAGKSSKTHIPFEFINDGRLSVNHTMNGTFFNWNYDRTNNTVTLPFNGSQQKLTIIKLGSSVMDLANDTLNYHFERDIHTLQQ